MTFSDFIQKIKNTNRLIFSLVFVMIIICFILIFQYTNLKTLETTVSNQAQTINLKAEEINRLKQEKEALKADLVNAAVLYDQTIQEKDQQIKTQLEQLSNSYVLPEYVMQNLATHKIESVQAIIKDLTSHKELIPEKGVLGGTMYWVTESTVILNDHYAFSCYEDGHILGYALLEYKFDQNEQIIWTVKTFFNN